MLSPNRWLKAHFQNLLNTQQALKQQEMEMEAPDLSLHTLPQVISNLLVAPLLLVTTSFPP
jgi:hypothetical protein